MPSSLIDSLALQLHPEGGYYRRVYQSSSAQYFASHNAERFLLTSIIYLLQGRNFSAFHQIRSDELWFLGGHNTNMIIHELGEGGYRKTILSRDNPFHCVSAGQWFAAELMENSDCHYALCYCSVSPGFDFDDFVLAESQALLHCFPEHKALIERLTRDV